MEEKKQGIHYAWKIMIGCCFLQAGALGAIMNSGGVFFVPICEDLGFDRGAIALYLTFYFIATTFTYPLVARFLPRWDFRKFLTGCFLILAAVEAAMGFFTELWQWYVGGIILGIAGALVFVVASTVLIENWFVEKRGTALGIAMCGSGIGGVIFPILGNFLIETIGWRMAYPAIAVIICVLVLPWTIFVFRLHPSDLGLEPYGADKAKEIEEAASNEKGMPAKRAICTLAFVCIFLYAGIEALFSGYNNHLPGFAESIGYSAAFGASILSLAQLGYTVATLVMGWVTDKIGVAASTYITLGIRLRHELGHHHHFRADVDIRDLRQEALRGNPAVLAHVRHHRLLRCRCCRRVLRHDGKLRRLVFSGRRHPRRMRRSCRHRALPEKEAPRSLGITGIRRAGS